MNQQYVTESPDCCGYVPQQPPSPEEVQQDNNGDTDEYPAIDLRRNRELRICVEQPVDTRQLLGERRFIDLIPEVHETPPACDNQQQQPECGAVEDDVPFHARHRVRIATVVEIIEQPDNDTGHPRSESVPRGSSICASGS